MNFFKNLPSRIIRKAMYAWRQGKDFVNLNEKFFRQARGAGIVCYHGICERDHLKFNNIFLLRKTFEAHLQFYKKYFHVISLGDFFKKNFDENKFNICITFDDGYYNNYKYVLPLMEAYKIPVTFFMTAIRDAGYDILWNDFLGMATKHGPQKVVFKNENFFKRNNQYTSVKTKERLADILRKNDFTVKAEMMKMFDDLISFRNRKQDEDFWQQMNIEDIKQLSSSQYTTIGAHGYYHNDLGEIAIDECKQELIRSKLFLQNICGKKIDAVAFPYGHYARKVVKEAKKAGYDKLLALDFHFKEDKSDTSMRERMIINPYLSVVNQMYAIIKGRYE